MALFRSADKQSSSFTVSQDDPWWEPPARDVAPLVEAPATEPNQATVTLRPPRSWLSRGPITPGVSHLMLLRGFVAFGWLRAAFDKIGDPQWWDGSTVTTFLSGGAAHQPIAGVGALADAVLVPGAVIVAFLVLVAELAIGVGVFTGVRFDAALGLGIGLAVAFVAAGQINPAAFYIVIQLALLGSPAGRTYAIEPWRVPPFMRWAPWALGATVAIFVWSALAAGSISTSSVSDPAAVLGFLALFAVASLTALWIHDRQTADSGHLDSARVDSASVDSVELVE